MRKLKLGLFGLFLTAAALTSVPRAESQQACTLLCIQGYHCCLTHSGQTCIPDSQTCKG